MFKKRQSKRSRGSSYLAHKASLLATSAGYKRGGSSPLAPLSPHSRSPSPASIQLPNGINELELLLYAVCRGTDTSHSEKIVDAQRRAIHAKARKRYRRETEEIKRKVKPPSIWHCLDLALPRLCTYWPSICRGARKSGRRRSQRALGTCSLSPHPCVPLSLVASRSLDLDVASVGPEM